MLPPEDEMIPCTARQFDPPRHPLGGGCQDFRRQIGSKPKRVKHVSGIIGQYDSKLVGGRFYLCPFEEKPLDNFLRYDPAEWRRHGMPNLARAMPFCCMEPKPVREAVKPRHLSDCYTARMPVMDRPRTGKRPSCRVGAGAQRVGNALRG